MSTDDPHLPRPEGERKQQPGGTEEHAKDDGDAPIPAFLSQAKSLIEAEPAMREKLAEWLSSSKLTAGLADAMRNMQYDTLFKSSAATVIGYSTRAVEILAYAVGAIFLALYILIDRDRLRGGLFAPVRRAHHVRLSRILLNLETIVGGYIRGQAITCALMGGFMFVLLTACGVPNALAISVFGGLADLLPYVGSSSPWARPWPRRCRSAPPPR